MKSRTLDKIDTAVAWVEGTEDRVTHWLRCHASWAWRQHATEETFTFTIAITGKLRERARALAVARIKHDLRKLGANGPYLQDNPPRYEERAPASDWLSSLPPTGKIRTPPVDNELEMHRHKATLRR